LVSKKFALCEGRTIRGIAVLFSFPEYQIAKNENVLKSKAWHFTQKVCTILAKEYQNLRMVLKGLNQLIKQICKS